MRVLTFILLLVACANASKFMDLIREEWNTYKIVYNKSYTLNRDGEEEFRMNIFMKNRMTISQHNARYARGEVTFELAVNQFADLTRQEFEDMYGSNSAGRTSVLNIGNLNFPKFFKMNRSAEVPPSFDWRDKGCVTPVKNQLRCLSCYAFSAIGSIECQHMLKTGQLVSLSVQNIIDCSQSYGNSGCEGGSPDNVFKYVIANQGVAAEAAYQYNGVEGKCRYDPKDKEANVTEYMRIPVANEAALMHAVATKGTISVSVDANPLSFQFYSKGIYYEPNCTSYSLNHAVVVVGYGTDEHGNDYWLVKNSWGGKWGDKGYIRIARNRNNHCGIATEAFYPVME